MNTQKTKKKIMKELLHDAERELSDEELITELLSTNVAESAEKNEKISFGQRAADAVARFAGSWAFIFSFIAVMVIWMVLNLVLSCIAAVQAPLIMMSQNRQEAKDRKRAQNDYRVNLKSEFVIDELYKRVEAIAETQKKILGLLKAKETESSNAGEKTDEPTEKP